MTKKQERELNRQYRKISEKLNKNLYNENELDSLLSTFTHLLTDNDMVTNEVKVDLLETLSELESINENKDYSNDKDDSYLNENIYKSANDEYEISTLQNIYSLWKIKDTLTKKELESEVSKITDEIDKFMDIEFSDEAMEHFNNIDFIHFIKKINFITVDIKKANDRLNSYFKINKKIKENTPRPIDTEFNTYYESNLLLAMKNEGIADQSQLNKIKSLGMGNLLSESIKVVIPKRKHSLIKRLHNIQEERYMEYLQTQSRLI